MHHHISIYQVRVSLMIIPTDKKPLLLEKATDVLLDTLENHFTLNVLLL